MKSNATLGRATRTAGKLFFALTLLVLAVAAGFGGTALIVYHHLDGGRTPATHNLAERKSTNRPADKAPGVAKEDAKLRQVAALPSDQPRYTYADNNGGQPSTPIKRERQTPTVPAPLENIAPSLDVPKETARLNDPESHYIVDSRTGRVVGIDGSAGARREQEEEQRRLEVAPHAVAAQTPAPEVRVASAVTEVGQPVYRDTQDSLANEPGSQSMSVRRALPVTTNATDQEPRNFNVAEYMAGGQSRPVLRAQPVAPRTTNLQKTLRVYRLSDGSQIVAAD